MKCIPFKIGNAFLSIHHLGIHLISLVQNIFLNQFTSHYMFEDFSVFQRPCFYIIDPIEIVLKHIWHFWLQVLCCITLLVNDAVHDFYMSYNLPFFPSLCQLSYSSPSISSPYFYFPFPVKAAASSLWL